MQKELESLWQKCVAFHGHGCGGLAVGFRAVLYAWELFESDSTSEDEEIVCIAETDACGVDAIQALLSCTVGKGNLIFNLQGKNAFSFYRRSDGKSFRLVLRPTPEKTKEERQKECVDGVRSPYEHKSRITHNPELMDESYTPMTAPTSASVET